MKNTFSKYQILNKSLHKDFTNEKNISPQKQQYKRIKEHFKKNRVALWSFRVVSFFVVIAILSGFLSNDLPIIAKKNGEVSFPIIKGYYTLSHQSKEKETKGNDWEIWAPIPYHPRNIDLKNSSVGPFDHQNVRSNRWRHWLGTDQLGHDVLAGLIHGTRTALLVGIISMGIAGLLGIFVGAISGYYGDRKLRMSPFSIVIYTVGLVLGIFYALFNRHYELVDALERSHGMFFLELFFSALIFLSIISFFFLVNVIIKRIFSLDKIVSIPLDLILSRFLEVFSSMPRLLLIISIAAIITKPSTVVLILIVGITAWVDIAKLTRAQFIKIKNLNYIEAVQALGYRDHLIIMKHILPNALPPILVSLAFGIAAVVILESSLSFLGVGLPAEEMTWGSVLSSARKDSSAWWLALFPGVAIFITVTCYNLIGESINEAINPKLQKD